MNLAFTSALFFYKNLEQVAIVSICDRHPVNTALSMNATNRFQENRERSYSATVTSDVGGTGRGVP